MRGFFRSKKFMVILCMLALSAGMMIYTFTRGGYVFSGQAMLDTVLNPVEKLANNIADSFNNGMERFTNSDTYYDENIELKSQISEYKQMEADYNETKKELEELKAFMGIKEEHSDYVLSDPCKIIGYTTNDPYGSFKIDHGSNEEDGIELYDPVVTSEGLVGLVTEIAPNYSIVTTIMSPDVSVSAVISSTNNTGVVEGTISLEKDNLTQMVHIDKSASKVKSGDLVVTSSTSGIFPSGYLIGTVKEVGNSESGLTKYATVEPSVDFSKLTTVMVICDFDGKGETDAED